MQTNYPTVEIHFVFAFTFCTLKVYKTQEMFIRKVLEIYDVEFLEPEESTDWQEIDTRVLSDLICGAFPKMLTEAGLTGQLAKTVLEISNIASMSTR